MLNDLYTPNDIQDIILKALDKLFTCDFDLLSLDANERSITHKLAEHLTPHFNDFSVDCEYNRYESSTKQLVYSCGLASTTTDTEGRTVFPDIIVHKRKSQNHNLLVIEVKKSSNRATNCDKEKIMAFLAPPYNYTFGYTLVIPSGPSACPADVKLTLIEPVPL